MHGTGELENLLMSPLDNDDNTIAHLAALGGHVAVFKVRTWKLYIIISTSRRSVQLNVTIMLRTC